MDQMPRVLSGVKGLILYGRQVLILLEPNGRFDLPGGRVETGENMEVALRREIMEETGLSIEIVALITRWAFMKRENLAVQGINYLCRYASGRVMSIEDISGMRDGRCIEPTSERVYWEPRAN